MKLITSAKIRVKKRIEQRRLRSSCDSETVVTFPVTLTSLPDFEVSKDVGNVKNNSPELLNSK